MIVVLGGIIGFIVILLVWFLAAHHVDYQAVRLRPDSGQLVSSVSCHGIVPGSRAGLGAGRE